MVSIMDRFQMVVINTLFLPQVLTNSSMPIRPTLPFPLTMQLIEPNPKVSFPVFLKTKALIKISQTLIRCNGYSHDKFRK